MARLPHTMSRVYPRVCGGTDTVTALKALKDGLSPRVRGNRCSEFRSKPCPWSIPACAGEPAYIRRLVAQSGVYPRVCGGTVNGQTPCRICPGLSPRVRGNPESLSAYPSVYGSIPACAGEPPNRRQGIRADRVYPRVCGGTASWSPPPAYPAGLSPRVRGNRGGWRWAGATGGSIPACAGEPYGKPGIACADWVYPRVCGGTAGQGCPTLPAVGLSPRVRGNPGPAVSQRVVVRSIPACAGEPLVRCSPWASCSVYPRVCGGTRTASTSTSSTCGLSPRVRGNHAHILRRNHH